MSPTYVTSLIVVLSALLPQLGVSFDSAQLTALVQAVVTILGGLYIMYRRYKQGGITVVGTSK